MAAEREGDTWPQAVQKLLDGPPGSSAASPPCVCISPLPASAGQPLPAQAPGPRPLLPESYGAGKSRAAEATGGGKGRLIFLYSSARQSATRPSPAGGRVLPVRWVLHHSPPNNLRTHSASP